MIKPVEVYEGLNATFNITEDCNLQCRYCYEVDKKPADLPIEYAKAFIDILLTDPDPITVLGTKEEWMLKSGLVIDLIGGDALMRPELCDQILSYFIFKSNVSGHRWASRWRCSISTNGTLLGEPDVKKFLMKYRDNISLGISIDGCPEIHNLNRSNSMDQILKNWDFYLWYTGKAASTKATLNRESIPFIFESVRYLHEELKLRQINMNFVFEPLDLTEDDLVLLDRQLEQTMFYILEHREDLYFSMFDKYMGRGKEMTDFDKGWCGAGAMPCLAVNGKIYPCFRFLPHTMSDRSFDFHVGDVWKGLNHKERFGIVRDQTRKKISPEKCTCCPIESTCAWCIGGAYSQKGTFFRQINICETHKIRDKWAGEYWRRYAIK